MQSDMQSLSLKWLGVLVWGNIFVRIHIPYKISFSCIKRSAPEHERFNLKVCVSCSSFADGGGWSNLVFKAVTIDINSSHSSSTLLNQSSALPAVEIAYIIR